LCNLLLLLNYNLKGCNLYLILLKYESKTFLDFINDNSIKSNNNENIKIVNVNNAPSENKEQEYKNKINKLEKYIKELELKMKEKDIIIKEEKIKNDNLNKKIKELENISNKNPQINNVIELENEIKLFRRFNKFSEGEKLISIKFISGEQDIDYSLITKNTEKFYKIEGILYEKYPKYVETDNFFVVNGNRINRNKTLEQNNIKNNDIITLIINNLD